MVSLSSFSAELKSFKVDGVFINIFLMIFSRFQANESKKPTSTASFAHELNA